MQNKAFESSVGRCISVSLINYVFFPLLSTEMFFYTHADISRNSKFSYTHYLGSSFLYIRICVRRGWVLSGTYCIPSFCFCWCIRARRPQAHLSGTVLLTIKRQARVGCAQLVGSHTRIVAEVLLCHVGDGENGSCTKILNNNSLLAIEEPRKQISIVWISTGNLSFIFILDG